MTRSGTQGAAGACSQQKIVLGISGGVDSTAAALLLLQKGYEVYGLYFNIHADGEGERSAARQALCEAYRAAGLSEAAAAAHFLYCDASERFRRIVIADFCREYRAGRTPNPCVLCNPTVKFHLLAEAADRVGAACLATGHYAGIRYDGARNVFYVEAAESAKDQSYMLYRLPQTVLSRLIFPLSGITEKEKTRALARENGCSSADKKDSQEICFLEKGQDHVDFIRRENGEDAVPPGAFIDRDGNVLGRHKGIAYYTIGQRKGLGIALGKPAFVTELNAEENTVRLETEESVLWKREAAVCDLFFTETGGEEPPADLQSRTLTAKVRYAAPRAAVEITGTGRAESGEPILHVVFRTTQRAITPGQSLVLYEGDSVIGGGRIKA